MNKKHFYTPIYTYTFSVLFATVSLLSSPAPVNAASPIANTITGKLVDSEGNPPVTAQTVFIADMSFLSDSNAALATPSERLSSHSVINNVVKDTSVTNQCAAPSVPYKSYSCTNNSGEFSLAVPSDSIGPEHLAIAGKRVAIKINIAGNTFGVNLGTITVPNVISDKPNKVAIVSLAATHANNMAQNLNTSNSSVISYLFDSEILTGYGIQLSDINIEYFTHLRPSTDKASILDTHRFSTVLIKGTWQEILKQYSQTTVNKMLQFVEQGGTLLIKNNISSSKNTSISDQYI